MVVVVVSDARPSIAASDHVLQRTGPFDTRLASYAAETCPRRSHKSIRRPDPTISRKFTIEMVPLSPQQVRVFAKCTVQELPPFFFLERKPAVCLVEVFTFDCRLIGADLIPCPS